jgi:hypothetical protein
MAAASDIFSRQLTRPAAREAHVVGEAEALWPAEAGRSFLVQTRVDVSLLWWWQRLGYVTLSRRLPAKWAVPGVPPMELAVFDDFAEADANCLTSDDKILVLPKGRAFSRDRVDAEECCRPRDTRDRANAARYILMRAKYETPAAGRLATVNRLAFSLAKWDEIRAELAELVSRLEAVAAEFRVIGRFHP